MTARFSSKSTKYRAVLRLRFADRAYRHVLQIIEGQAR
jgi:hypothetical protein